MSRVDIKESWWKRTRTHSTLFYRQYRPLVWLAICVVAALVIVVAYALWQSHRSELPFESAAEAHGGVIEMPKSAPIAPALEKPEMAVTPSSKTEAPIPSAQAAEPAALPVVAKPKAVPKKARSPKAKERPLSGRTVAGEFRWERFGAAPYARTRTEAMRSRERAFRALGIPAPVVRQLMRATEMPGERIRLVNGDRLSAMLSKGSAVHRNVVVDFVKPPISGKMEYAAPAEAWRVVWQGKTYEVILPDVCNNWSRRDSIPVLRQTEAVEECAEVPFHTQEGDIVRFAVLGDERLPASACFALKEAGDTAFRAPPVHCPDADCDFSGDVAVVGRPVQHSGGYVAHAGENVLRLPAAVAAPGSSYVEVLCLERGGRQTMGVGIRSGHFLGDHPKRARIYDAPEAIPRGLPPDYDLAWRWVE